MYSGTRTMFGASFSSIGEGHLQWLLISLFSRRILGRVLISLFLLHAAPYNLARKCTSLRPINPIKTAPVCCELMDLLGILRFPAQNPIGCNRNLRTHFQQDALPRVPWLPSTFVDINDLRMRINLQHRDCFPLAAVGVKMFIYWMFGAL